MRKILYIWLVLLLGCGSLCAQSSENLIRNVIVTLDQSQVVEQGEFQMELQKGVFFDSNNENPWFSFIYTVTNKFTGTGNIMVNNQPKIVHRNVQVRAYKVGATLGNSVFVVKNRDASNSNMRQNMEVVMAKGVTHPICDSVLYLNDDGYVFSLDGHCYYSLYKDSYDNQSQTEQIVWLDKKTFEQDLKFDDKAKSDAFARLSKGDVYFESSEGHYYYLYRDQFMPNTVLVVDNRVVELHDIYDESDFKLKFSYNGEHWMAVGKQCFWVDGEIKSVEGYIITDFVITNDGDYGYKARRIEGSEKGEVVVYNGKIVRRHADVCYFGMNGEGTMKIRFVVGGRYLQYENENTVDVTDKMVSVYYPNEKSNRLIQVLSDDGAHRLTYRRGVQSVEIDGVKVAETEPCYAVYDQRNNAFIWNAVEVRDMKTELVVYRYTVANKLFKKLFK